MDWKAYSDYIDNLFIRICGIGGNCLFLRPSGSLEKEINRRDLKFITIRTSRKETNNRVS